MALFVSFVAICLLPRLLDVMNTRIYNPLFHSDLVFRFSKWYNVEKSNAKITNDFVDDILRRKKIAYQNDKLNKSKSPDAEAEEEGASFKKPQVFIDQLLKLSMEGNFFTDQEVKDEANTIVATVSPRVALIPQPVTGEFLSQGYESTALITSYCLLMLAMYPEMQDKCYEEIQSVLPNKEDDLSYDDLSKLDYVERCLKETMRLFPTVPVVARKVDMDFQLSEYRWPVRLRGRNS